MKEYATLFTGGDLWGKGAEAAGLVASWGVECDAKVADYAELNTGARVIRDYVERVDYSLLPVPFWLHMSPVCKNASQAKKDGKEEAEDLQSAEGCARAIDALQPPNISLENVWGYRNFESFRIILRTLERNGYSFNFWHLNAADFGVPQTRQRLILLASKTHRPTKPRPTHTKNPRPAGLFGEGLPKWVGWYEAIADLIPTLPESKFAEWQLKRLGSINSNTFFSNNIGTGAGDERRTLLNRVDGNEPAFTIASNRESVSKYRAFLMDSKNTGQERGKLHRAGYEPALTEVEDGKPSHMPRAFIVDPFNSSHADITRDAPEPLFTITANNGNGRRNPLRAFIAHPSADNDRFVVRHEDEPTFTTTNTSGTPRAFIVSPHQSESLSGLTIPVRADDEPTVSVNTHSAGHVRAWLSQGRVVSMTPRALARFQSVPDSYVLPEHNGLACQIIGNGVPCLMVRRVIESHLERLKRAA